MSISEPYSLNMERKDGKILLNLLISNQISYFVLSQHKKISKKC